MMHQLLVISLLLSSQSEIIQALPSFGQHCYNKTHEECCIYIFTGVCNPNCAHSGAHVPPAGKRKADILEYNKGCVGRYDANKPANGPDFR